MRSLAVRTRDRFRMCLRAHVTILVNNNLRHTEVTSTPPDIIHLSQHGVHIATKYLPIPYSDLHDFQWHECHH